jgi:hypothetical protein
MASRRKCRACGVFFSPDFRNEANQAFCPRPECRRSRRAEAQRQRRNLSRQGDRLTRRLKPSEARWLQANPMIVGLISVLIGSTDMMEIEAFCAAASLRGRKLLDGVPLEEDANSPKNQGRNEAPSP